MRAYAIATLTSLGYRVVSATSDPEALSLLEGGAKIDLLFTDIVTPGGMNGCELAARGRGQAEMLLLDKPYRKSERARRVREALAARPLPAPD